MPDERASPTPDAADLEAAERAIAQLPRRRDQLLPAFLAAQHAIGWLPRAAIEAVARHTRIPVSEVYATATAYSELLLEPPVNGEWALCGGVSCDRAGAGAVHAAHEDRTRLVDCQFLCALAPVAVDPHERLVGRVTSERMAALLEGSS